MTKLSSKNDGSSQCHDVIITHHKKFVNDKFDDFSCDIDYNSETHIFTSSSYLPYNYTLLAQKPQGCLRRTQNVSQLRTQASEARYIYIIYIYIYTRIYRLIEF